MSPFSWQCQNSCRMSLAFIREGRVVTQFGQRWTTWESFFLHPTGASCEALVWDSDQIFLTFFQSHPNLPSFLHGRTTSSGGGGGSGGKRLLRYEAKEMVRSLQASRTSLDSGNASRNASNASAGSSARIRRLGQPNRPYRYYVENQYELFGIQIGFINHWVNSFSPSLSSLIACSCAKTKMKMKTKTKVLVCFGANAWRTTDPSVCHSIEAWFVRHGFHPERTKTFVFSCVFVFVIAHEQPISKMLN